MLRRRDPPAFHRIIVQILQLLVHHRVIGDNLRMRALLPDLVFVWFVCRTPVTKLLEQPGPSFHRKLENDFAGRKTFEITQDSRQVRRGQDGVEMIVQDDPSVDFQGFALTAMFQRTHQDVATRG